jgi:CheY-like chemotaxis protein
VQHSDPTVLLVEDNEINQAVAVAMLEQQGYRVDVVPHGQAALDAVADASYAAVLMDCQMPVMDGYAAAAELRRREGEDEHLPIIALTAHAFDGERERCLAAGMDDFLAKPVRADELASALQRHVDPPLVDPRAADRLRDAVGSEQLVAQIMEMFLVQAASHIETLRCAVTYEDTETAIRTAHSLKGSAMTVGATAIARVAAEVERGDFDAVPRLSECVERTCARLATA